MKKFFNKTILYILMPTLIMSNVSCTGDPECDSSIIDLTIQVSIAAGSTIIAGVPFNVGSLIPCALKTGVDCQDQIRTAVASVAKMATSKKQASGQYTNIENKNYNVPQIPADSQANTNVATTFTEPGDYQIITFADVQNNVNEFDENNNSSNPLNAGARMVSQTIHVLPNPNYKKPANAPTVIMEIGETKIEPINHYK